MLNTDYRSKLVNVEHVLSLIKPGNRIFLSSGPAIPAHTVSAIMNSGMSNLMDLEIIHLITLGDYLSSGAKSPASFRLKTFNVGQSIGKDVAEGKVDFIPANLIEIPYILASGALGIDVAVVQASPPDSRGFLNLGIAIDVANIAIKKASIVVAEINPNVPVTYGETSIHVDQVHYMVESTMPLIERERKPYDATMDRIGWHIANLTEDGSTVVLHAGRIFDAIAAHLKDKKGLGVYTHVISDWAIDLVESGAIPMDRSRYRGGLITSSYCYGTRRLYDYVDRNPIFEFYPIARLVNPFVMQRMPQTDQHHERQEDRRDRRVGGLPLRRQPALGLRGQVQLRDGRRLFGKQGKAIVALQSEDRTGNSNIVISHDQDAERVRATLGVTRYVVTEYGVANLFGKSIRERVLSMIDIAHPRHREQLLKLAKVYGYAYPDQIYTC